jgi:sulfate adenylyltransferase
MAGPREAVWHAIIRRNYGANHFIIGRSHACPGADSKGEPFYPPEAANDLAEKYAAEIGVQILSSPELTYSPAERQFVARSQGEAAEAETRKLSGSRVRDEFLASSQKPPEWITRPEIAEILQDGGVQRIPGVCIWMTGLSGAGKSATAEALTTRLNQLGRAVTLLDGDVVRTNLSKGLGFSREDRETNMLRIGFVAAEVVRHGGIAVCAAISPFRGTRNRIRQMVGPNFIEVFVNTPLEICESRDTKGMYQAARRGEIKSFTGVDDPYEEPKCAELTIGTVDATVAQNVTTIMKYLESRRLIAA